MVSDFQVRASAPWHCSASQINSLTRETDIVEASDALIVASVEATATTLLT